MKSRKAVVMQQFVPIIIAVVVLLLIIVWATGGFSNLFKTTDDVNEATGPDDLTLVNLKCQNWYTEAKSTGQVTRFCTEIVYTTEEGTEQACADIMDHEGVNC